MTLIRIIARLTHCCAEIIRAVGAWVVKSDLNVLARLVFYVRDRARVRSVCTVKMNSSQNW